MKQDSSFDRVRVIEPETISKNRAIQKNQLSKGIFLLLLFLLPSLNSFGQQQYKNYTDGIDLSNSLINQKKYDEAILVLTKITKYPAPNNVNNAWLGLAKIYYELKKYDETINSVNTFLDLAAHSGNNCTTKTLQYDGTNYCLSEDDFLWAQLALVYCYQMKENDELTLPHLNAIISIKPTGYTLHSRGVILNKQGKVQEAINDFKQAIMDKDYDANAKNGIISGVINYYESNNFNNELYNFLKELPNKNAEQYNKLAYASFQKNNLEEADQYYNEALRLQPSISINVAAREASQKYVAEKKEERRRQEEIQRKEAEVRRMADLKKAQVGDKLLYSETWGWKEGMWWFETSGSYTMMVTCFIERIEGDRYQLRVGDVTSSDSNRFATPSINGVRVNKGDLIWARPLNGNRWVYGESF